MVLLISFGAGALLVAALAWLAAYCAIVASQFDSGQPWHWPKKDRW